MVIESVRNICPKTPFWRLAEETGCFPTCYAARFCELECAGRRLQKKP